MYPLHKYLPTPFGTYLLYIDNGPTRVQANKDKLPLPSYQAAKEYGRKQLQQQHVSKYQAFQKPIGTSGNTPAKIPQQQSGAKGQVQERKKTYTPSSTMPTSIWSPKVKRMHLSYNMRQLWHTGQPVRNGPPKVIEVDEVTGADLIREAQWHRDRSSKEHEGIASSERFKEHLAYEDYRRRSELSTRSEVVTAKACPASQQDMHKSRIKVPPNTTANSPILSEVYKRRASSLRHDMVPRMQKKMKRGSKAAAMRRRNETSGFERSHVNKETQTTPLRNAKTSMEYSPQEIAPGVLPLPTPQRSSSVPISTPASDIGRRSRNCVEKTGLPPILEAEIPSYNIAPQPVAKTAEVESHLCRQRVRRVQEFRSASPTFPIKSKGDLWEEISRNRSQNITSHNLLPFTWKEPKRFRTEGGNTQQQRALEVEKILPVISRMPSIPRIANN